MLLVVASKQQQLNESQQQLNESQQGLNASQQGLNASQQEETIGFKDGINTVVHALSSMIAGCSSLWNHSSKLKNNKNLAQNNLFSGFVLPAKDTIERKNVIIAVHGMDGWYTDFELLLETIIDDNLVDYNRTDGSLTIHPFQNVEECKLDNYQNVEKYKLNNQNVKECKLDNNQNVEQFKLDNNQNVEQFKLDNNQNVEKYKLNNENVEECKLRDKYYFRAVTIDNNSNTEPDEDMIKLIDQIDGYKNCNIILIGHSKGGLVVSRYAATKNDDRIKKVITISSPLRGTKLVNLFVNKEAPEYKIFSYNNDIARQTEALIKEKDIDFYHVVPGCDHVIIPDTAAMYESTHKEHIYNYGGCEYSHVGILANPDVGEYILRWIQ
jgi:hypothetical protein